MYKGVYGEWRVEESDRLEVQGYRAGLSVAAAGMLAFFSHVVRPEPQTLAGSEQEPFETTEEYQATKLTVPGAIVCCNCDCSGACFDLG